MAMIPELANLPDVSYIDGLTLEDIQNKLVELFTARYQETTGKPLRLRKADPRTRFLYACGEVLDHGLEYVDRAGKQDLLKYTYGPFLDNLAAFWGLIRNPAAPAQCILRFTVSEPRDSAVVIPARTRATPGNNIYFATTEYAEVPAGHLWVDVPAECETPGEAGNYYDVGAVRQLVDPIAFIDSVANIDVPSGGADVESDDQLRVRTFLAPASYSTAGPIDAYIQMTLSYSSAIGSCNVASPKPGVVEVRVLLEDGGLPAQGLCDEIYDFLSDKTRRPLTDQVFVMPPDTVEYDTELTYWISRAMAGQAEAIRRQVADAVDAYNVWQQTEISRDINPSELIHRVMAAGAKRVQVELPGFQVLTNQQVARLRSSKLIYGGIEDD